MTLVSVKFILFSLVVLLLYYVLPKKFRWIILLAASYIFYFLSSKFLTIFIILSSISVYITGLLINKQNKKIDKNNIELNKKIKRNKKLFLLFAVLLNVAFLLVLKYSNFFIDISNSIFKTNFGFVKILLPLGISYYTLEAISYIADIYMGKYEASKNFFAVNLFLIFFPTITEGPICKFNDVSPKLMNGNSIKYENLINGAGLMLFGYFKKLVIADRAGIYVNNVFGNTSLSGSVVFFAIALYTIQIYAEFSGCMDIVCGLSKMLGIDLPKNFERPFFSKSIQEFWRRWHKTLGVWLKDYVFYPISFSKLITRISKFSRKKLSKNLAKFLPVASSLFFVWFLNGFWHGASFKYILYGLYYYIVMMIGLLLKPYTDKLLNKLKINIKSKGYGLFQTIRTTLLVFVGMMLFRSKTITAAIDMFKSIFRCSKEKLTSFGLTNIDFIIILIGIILLFIYGILEEKGIDVVDKLNKKPLVIRYLVYLIICLSIIVFGIYGPGYNPADFIYGQF